MIKIYQYHSNGLQSNVKLSYNDGALCAVEIENTPATAVQEKAYFFQNEETFVKMCKTHNVPFIEVERALSFEIFWEKYNYKASGRIPTLKAWEKLSKTEQIAAYDYIATYEAHLKMSRTAKKYGATYLNSKIYIK